MSEVTTLAATEADAIAARLTKGETAWARTSVSMIGFGFTIYNFYRGLLQGPIVSGRQDAARNLGLALVAACADRVVKPGRVPRVRFELIRKTSQKESLDSLQRKDGVYLTNIILAAADVILKHSLQKIRIPKRGLPISCFCYGIL